MINGLHAILFSEDAERLRVFLGEVSDQGWGRLASIKLPGGGELGLYEPRHPSPIL
jgi:hypothetical protein